MILVPVRIGKQRATDYARIVMKKFLKGGETVSVKGRGRMVHKTVLAVSILCHSHAVKTVDTRAYLRTFVNVYGNVAHHIPEIEFDLQVDAGRAQRAG